MECITIVLPLTCQQTETNMKPESIDSIYDKKIEKLTSNVLGFVIGTPALVITVIEVLSHIL